MVFPALSPPITVDQLTLLACQAVHEPGHHLREGSLKLLYDARIPAGHPIANIWNIVEDEAMEREVQIKWRGDRQALVEGHRILAGMMADSFGTAKREGKQIAEHSMKSMATYLTALESRRDWDYLSEANISLIRGNLHDEAVELADELIAEGWADRIQKGGTPEEIKRLAYDLFERLYPGEKAEDQEMPEQTEGEGAEGEGEDGEGKGQASKYEDSEDGDGSEAQKGKFYVVKWSDIVQSEHGQGMMAPSEIDWTGHRYDKGNVRFLSEEEITRHDYSHNKNTGTRNEFGDSGLADKQFANQVRRLIQAELRIKNEYELKSGKLDKRNMIRVLLPSREGGDWNRRVFTNVEEKLHLNTAITVLTDWSGSMTGSKMRLACNATQRLADTFGRALRVPTEVLAFTGGWHDMDFGIIKPFEEKTATSADIGRRFTTFQVHTSGNPDGDAIMEANARLLKRPEARKILIVLSDGSPAGGAGESGSVLHASIEEVRRTGTEVYGIGIESAQVRHFYGEDCEVINHANELNNALLRTLSKMVRHGRH